MLFEEGSFGTLRHILRHRIHSIDVITDTCAVKGREENTEPAYRLKPGAAACPRERTVSAAKVPIVSCPFRNVGTAAMDDIVTAVVIVREYAYNSRSRFGILVCKTGALFLRDAFLFILDTAQRFGESAEIDQVIVAHAVVVCPAG